MKRKLSKRSVVFAICSIGALAATEACATEFSTDMNDWQSFQNQVMVDEHNQASDQQRKEFRSNLKSAVVNSIQALGIPETPVRYMGAAIGLATQDTVIHLNDNKTLALEIMDVTQSDRGVFVGYSSSW